MGGGARTRARRAMTAGVSGTVQVRPARVEDLARVAEIEAASFSDPWSDDAFIVSLKLPHIRFLVAEAHVEAHVVAGAGESAGAPALEGYVIAMVLGPEGEIADIAVTPDARGRGVGRALLDEIIVDLRGRGVRTLYLEVRESNAAARRLYASRGFGAVGRRRGYYRGPTEDALLLRRDFDDS